jgi:hypothetical protein
LNTISQRSLFLFKFNQISSDDEAPSSAPSSAPTAESDQTGGSGGNGGGPGEKSGKRRALADARGKLILDNIKINRKKARNGAKNEWDNNFF